MKKRILASLMALVMVITLTACGGNEGGTISEDMSNHNQMKMITVNDDWVYGIGNSSKEYKDIVFTATKKDGSDKKVITKDSIPTFVNVVNDQLYYILQLPEGSNLYKSDLDGKNRKMLLNGVDVCSYQIVGDTMYFQELAFEDNMPMGFFKCNLDGSNPEPVLEEMGFYPYVVGDKLYYQDPFGEDYYNVYDMKTKKTKKLTGKFTYMLSVDEENAYAVECDKGYFDGGTTGDLVKINLASKEKETLVENVQSDCLQVADEYIYYIDGSDHKGYRVKKSGGSGKLVVDNDQVGSMYIYGNDIVYITYDETGYFDKAYSCDYKGKGEKEL